MGSIAEKFQSHTEKCRRYGISYSDLCKAADKAVIGTERIIWNNPE